jgi:hypothetical protein
MPTADGTEGIIKERISLDNNDPNLLRDEMTTIDNSLTRPWTVMKIFKRQAKVWWSEDNCIEGQAYVTIGRQVYFHSADGTIKPMKKDAQSDPGQSRKTRSKRLFACHLRHLSFLTTCDSPAAGDQCVHQEISPLRGAGTNAFKVSHSGSCREPNCWPPP